MLFRLVRKLALQYNRVEPSIFHLRRPYSDFKSTHNVSQLYPTSNPDAYLQKPPNEESLISKDKFNGYIPIDKLEFTYSCSSGPGGQNVNKNQTKVQVRFHVPSASWIPENIKHIFMEREANRITKHQYFIISSDRTRKQILNQADCLERIRRILRQCTEELDRPEPSLEYLELVEHRKVEANEKRLRQKHMKSMTKIDRRCDMYSLED